MKGAWIALLVTLHVAGVVQAQHEQAMPARELRQPESVAEPIPPGNNAADEEEVDKPDDDLDKLMSMDLDQLTKVDVTPSSVTIPDGTLTATTTDSVSPLTVTHITREMIEKSGARTLNELLDIFVPNLQVIRHHSYYPHIGIRGIVSDRDDKYLLRVNGRVMNNRFIVGADSERDLPMLRDINFVDVIRGPGSTTYGAGALAGVINITTLNGTTFQGLDVNARQGFEQYMTTTEIRWGKSLGEDSGLFAYYGFADQPGADADDSPLINGRSGALPNGYPPAVAGQPAPFGIPNDESANQGVGKHKVHLQYTKDTWDFWARLTRGSYINPLTVRNAYRPPYGIAAATSNLDNRPGVAGDYQQITFCGSKVWELSDEFNISTLVSWDSYDFVESRYNSTSANPVDVFLPAREEELYFRIMAQYTPDDIQAVAIGFEESREVFGLNTAISDHPARGQRLGFINDAWVTHTASVLGEYRLKLLDPLTVILAGRLDDHTYSRLLFSPRISTIYDASDIDLIKFNIGQSVRKQGDEELRFQYISNGTLADAEILKNIELRWERRPWEHFSCGASVFYYQHEVVGFAGSVSRSLLLGTFESWGWELEANYEWGSNYLSVSQGYAKLLNGSLVDPTLIQGISAAPYGFGNDFANWSPYLTKVAWARNVDERTNISSSLRVYWAFPGARDLAHYNESLPIPSGSIGQADPGYDKAFNANVYLDMGYQRKLNDHLSWRLDLYNVLGWIDIDLNKRNYINRVSDYRPEAAAVGISATATY